MCRWIDRSLVGALLLALATVAWTVAGAHIALGIAAFLAVVGALRCRMSTARRTPADLAFLAYAVASVVAALAAIPAAASIVPLKKLALIPTVHVTAAVFATPRRLRLALRVGVFAIAATALVAMLAHGFGASTQDRLRSTGHYMTFSGVLLLALPLAAAGVLRGGGRWRGAYAVAFGVLALALGLTFTRSAWLGSFVALAMVLLRWRPRVVLLLPVLALAVYFLVPAGFRERARSSFDPSHPTNLDRQRMWQAGLQIWRDHPWTGVGLGDLQPVYRQYAPPDVERIHGHFHDNAIQILASMGFVGLLAFVWLMVSWGRIFWAAAARAPQGELQALAWGAWGAFWGFQVMGLFEWNFGDVEVTIALYLLVGLACALGWPRRPPQETVGTTRGLGVLEEPGGPATPISR